MTSTKPITIDGVTYDQLHINLNLSTRVENGKFTGMVAMRLLPFTIINGQDVQAPDEYAIPVVIGDTLSKCITDPNSQEAKTIVDLRSSLQDYINSRNL